jgi:hypothetical protein
MSNKENAHNSNNMDIDNEDEWEEESTYMIMDLGSDLTIDLLKRSLEINNGYSIIGLDTDQPMFKIGNFVYKGEVDYSLGTDLIFEVDENKINKEKDNLESSIHPSNASLKQSSSVYSYLTGEDPSKSSQGLPLIPLTQTTKKMVFHSVLLEQKDDELSGKEKLPDSLLPNLSPNTLFMNKDAILNSMAVGTGDISPISISGTSSPSKSKSKTIEKITLMDAVSDIVNEKSKENKINKPINNIDLDSPETSQIFNPEMSINETNDFGSNEVSHVTTNTETPIELNNNFENNEILQFGNSSKIIELNNNDESQIIRNKNSEMSDNKVSQIVDIDSNEISKISNTENSNVITISSSVSPPILESEEDLKEKNIENKLNSIENKLNQIIISNNDSKKTTSKKTFKANLKDENIEKEKDISSLDVESNKEIRKGNIKKTENKKRNKGDEELKSKKSTTKSKVSRKKSIEDNNKSEVVIESSNINNGDSQTKEKPVARRKRSSNAIAIKKSNTTRGRKPKNPSLKSSTSNVAQKKIIYIFHIY